MNPWQLAQQIKHALATVTWPGGSQDVVFGDRSVFVYAGSQPSEETLPPGFPFALVTLDGAQADPDDPDLLMQSVTITVAVDVTGDALGEFAVIGSSRADLGKSAGAGIAEVSERVRAAVQKLTGVDGASLIVSGAGSGSTTALGRGRHLAIEDYRVQALCTSQPFYAAPQQLKLVGSTFTWKGAHCAERFDFMRYRIGYKTGSTPAATPADCTAIVFTGTHAQAAVTIAPGRAYSVFADYDARGTGTPAASSNGTAVGAFVTT